MEALASGSRNSRHTTPCILVPFCAIYGSSMDKTAENQASPPVPEKRPARSGYSRLKRRHHWLISEHEKLQADFAALEAAFSELKELNSILVSDLRAMKHPRPMSPMPHMMMGSR